MPPFVRKDKSYAKDAAAHRRAPVPDWPQGWARVDGGAYTEERSAEILKKAQRRMSAQGIVLQ